MADNALKRPSRVVDLTQKRLVLVNGGPVDKLEERSDPRQILEVLRDQERAGLEHQHPGPALQRTASCTLVDLGCGERAIHSGSDHDHVELEAALPLRIGYLVDRVAHEPGEGIQREGGLLHVLVSVEAAT